MGNKRKLQEVTDIGIPDGGVSENAKSKKSKKKKKDKEQCGLTDKEINDVNEEKKKKKKKDKRREGVAEVEQLASESSVSMSQTKVEEENECKTKRKKKKNKEKIQGCKLDVSVDGCDSYQVQTTSDCVKVKGEKRKHKEIKSADNETRGNYANSELHVPCSENELETEIIVNKKKHKKEKKKTKETEENESCLNNSIEGAKTLNADEPKSKKKKKRSSKCTDERVSKQFETAGQEEGCLDRVKNTKVTDTPNGKPMENILPDTAITTNNTVGQWHTATFEDESRQQKFLRLLGGFKKGSDNNTINSKFQLGKKVGGSIAMNKTQEKKYHQELENQFDKAVAFKLDRGGEALGLGFTKPASEGKKFHIDVNQSKSMKFED